MSLEINVSVIKRFNAFAKVISEIKSADFLRKVKSKAEDWYAVGFKLSDCEFSSSNCKVCGGYHLNSTFKGYSKSVRNAILCKCENKIKKEKKEKKVEVEIEVESESEEVEEKSERLLKKKSPKPKPVEEEKSERLLKKKVVVEKKSPKSETRTSSVKTDIDEVEGRGLQLKKYSEKSFAVYGDTKSCKEDLKRLGGKFNMNLKEGPGWIFRSAAAPAVSAWLEDNE